MFINCISSIQSKFLQKSHYVPQFITLGSIGFKRNTTPDFSKSNTCKRKGAKSTKTGDVPFKFSSKINLITVMIGC